ncbi:MAG: CoA-binding protein [Candidatus Paceibacterota bacterium]
MKNFLNPKTIAVIGATNREGSVGRGLMENLLKGEKKIFPVNPRVEEVLGLKTFPEIGAIEEDVDLAIIAIPQKYVKKVVKDCAEKRVGGVIIISAGFGETGPEGKKEEEEIKEILKEKNIPLMGPNCLGVIRPSSGLNASFAPDTPKAGGIAFISQSGALIDSVIDGSLYENYGFSFLLSPGNAAGLSLVDYINWANEDAETKVIALYIEGVKNGREFFEVVKNSNKPVIVIKGGKSKVSQKAVSSHTGSLAGEAKIFSAALKQAGAIEVSSITELFNVGKALSWQKQFQDGIGIVTNGGGAGVIMTDHLEGEKLPGLKKETLDKMSQLMHPGYSASNPLDIVGDASAERYDAAIRAVLEQENINAIAVIQTLQIMTEPEKNAKILIEAHKEHGKTIVACFMGKGEKTQKAVSLLEEHGIPNYHDPLGAAQALKALNIKKKMKKIVFEKEKCIGCGACAATCPDFWGIGEDGKADLKEGHEEDGVIKRDVEEAGCNMEASQNCPVQCIHVEEA